MTPGVNSRRFCDTMDTKGNTYRVAGLCFAVEGVRLCKIIDSIEGFAPFATAGGDVLFSFAEGGEAPAMTQLRYEFEHEGVRGRFGRTEHGMLLTLDREGEVLSMWHNVGEKVVLLNGKMESDLCRFAMWTGLGWMIAPHGAVAMHASCIVYRGKAVLFLGASGTGKSTHTRLWLENIDGAQLLNDDSPFLRAADGKVWAHGSPWSGKTPCYKQERYELAGCVRLSQAPYNEIRKLGVLQAYGAIHPSCPPAFAYDNALYDHISGLIDSLLSSVPCYHLACLPDREAALLSFNTMFAGEAK